MNDATIGKLLRLIISRSAPAHGDALIALLALQKKLPMDQARYRRMLNVALSDPSANWTPQETKRLRLFFKENIDKIKPHIVRLTDADWSCALEIGHGNGSQGIRTALRAHGAQDGTDQPND